VCTIGFLACSLNDLRHLYAYRSCNRSSGLGAVGIRSGLQIKPWFWISTQGEKWYVLWNPTGSLADPPAAEASSHAQASPGSDQSAANRPLGDSGAQQTNESPGKMSRGAVGRAVAREITAHSIAAMNDMGFGDSSSEMSAVTQSMSGLGCKPRLPSLVDSGMGYLCYLNGVTVIQDH
jgi:hypothetical protein